MNFWKRLTKEPERTVVQLRRLNAPVTYAESYVFYDAWGTPYARANLYSGHSSTLHDLILQKGGGVDDFPYQTQWRHKSGPPVSFPDRVSERQARGWTPDESGRP